MRRSLVLVSLLACACGSPERTSQPKASPSQSAANSVIAGPPPKQAIAQRAESRRDPSAIGEDLLSSPRVDDRRAVARALARIATADARPKLLRLLADDDPETLAFAAYGLGQTCTGDRDGTTRALIARAVSLSTKDATGFAPWPAVARAIGRCGTNEGEATLAAWTEARDARARAACLGLGDVAEKRKLAEETVVLLAKAAPELGEAMFPFSRTDQEGNVATRVRELAEKQLGRPPSPERIFAVRTLGRTGPDGATKLGAVLADSAFSEAERAEAARSLGRLAARGQLELGKALPGLIPGNDPVSQTSLVSSAFGPLATTVESLTHPVTAGVDQKLDTLAKAPIADAAPTSLKRRLARLRCAAAEKIANDPGDPRLVACAPDKPSDVYELARLTVLARKPIKGKERAAIFAELVRSPSARVRATALEVVATHREIEEASELIAWALAHEHPGTVAAAAQALATRPEIATTSIRPAKRAAPPDLSAALEKALGRTFGPDDTETVAAIVAAAGALRLTAAKPRLTELCKSPWPTLRAHAQRALTRLGDKEVTCTDAVPHEKSAAELDAPTRQARLVFDTDAGELVLDVEPSLAPTAATRLVDLARAGFYDGMAVHRVVPGFVVQFGDRAGDGTGGAGKEPLRCETSPVAFEPLSIGVALAGRDTGSSQFFVTLSRVAHLDGEYAWVGKATGDWAAVTEGDVIRKVSVGTGARLTAAASPTLSRERRATRRRRAAGGRSARACRPP